MRTDRTAVLSAERQEPCTAAEHAAAEGHQEEYGRDVPRTCICTWQWNPAQKGYRMIRWWDGCPRHADKVSARGQIGLW